VFPILQVDPNSLIGDEQLGSKSKFWFEHGGKRWLFKLAREHTGEDWAEKVASEVAKFVPVDAARIELADYRGRRGSASLSFIAEHESLVHGNEILAGQIFGYDRQKKLRQSDHTFENIVAAIRKLVGGADWYHEVLKEIARYIVLDALICNTDRHHENWGFLTSYQRDDTAATGMVFRMAPSFDHAS
jgi:HipA-like C-terminal domain